MTEGRERTRVWQSERTAFWYDTCEECVTTHGPWSSQEQAQAFADEHDRAAGHLSAPASTSGSDS